MDAWERMQIERACERLVVQYCHFVDHGEAARIADLFTEDGVWSSPEATLEGAAAIRRAFEARQANERRISRHVCDNFLLDVIDPDRAEGRIYLTLYRHDLDEGHTGPRVAPLSGPLAVGGYRDRFVRTAKGWRIARRDVEVSFSRAVG